MTFSLFDILLIIILSQGIFLSIVLQLIPNKNKSANRILSFILLIASVMCLGRVLAFKYDTMFVRRIGIAVDGTIFLFGPLLYLYFRRLLFKEKNNYTLPYIHYIILFVFAIYVIWTFTLDQEGFQVNYHNGILPKLFFLIEFVGLSSFAFYTYKLAILLSTYKKHEHTQIAYNQGILSYVKRVIIAVSIFIGIWLFSFISAYFFTYYHPLFNYSTMWLSTSLFMYFIGFYSLTQPEIFRIPIKLTKKKAPRDRLSKDAVASLKNALNYAMAKEHLHLKPELSLIMLADHVNASPNNLSWYLNKIENKTFYHFINEYRINAFIKKVENNEHEVKTVLAMAFEAGFNTKSTFNKSFRAILDTTPAQYIKKSSENKSDGVQLVD